MRALDHAIVYRDTYNIHGSGGVYVRDRGVPVRIDGMYPVATCNLPLGDSRRRRDGRRERGGERGEERANGDKT